jgi:hypothetical protein
MWDIVEKPDGKRPLGGTRLGGWVALKYILRI